jgi:hypothetical protein
MAGLVPAIHALLKRRLLTKRDWISREDVAMAQSAPILIRGAIESAFREVRMARLPSKFAAEELIAGGLVFSLKAGNKPGRDR